MALIQAIYYDPAVAVTKPTTAALAMTPIDSTNLRLTFTSPSDRVLVRLVGILHGNSAFPQIFLGLMDTGSIVLRRIPPRSVVGGTSTSTTMVQAEALFVMTGLTPGASYTWDAAYGVETAVTSTALKYGGPNDTTANNAWGPFIFEVWDA